MIFNAFLVNKLCCIFCTVQKHSCEYYVDLYHKEQTYLDDSKQKQRGIVCVCTELGEMTCVPFPHKLIPVVEKIVINQEILYVVTNYTFILACAVCTSTPCTAHSSVVVS